MKIVDYILKAMPIILQIAQTAEDFRRHLAAQQAIIQTMRDEDRGPTKAEWDALFALVESNSKKLQKAKDDKKSEEI
jgi:hypothetical protein